MHNRLRQFTVLFWLIVAGPPGRITAQYISDGEPTTLEEEIRWRVNRGRFDVASENQSRGTAYLDVPASSGPLAPNQSLTLAARHHSEDMATQNLFQHATIPGSAYYDPSTQPNPWDRMKAEGYTWNNAGENIAAGYTGAEAAYVGWWNSTGHRKNMYNGSLREIGNGYFYKSASSYRGYYTMDLGSSGNHIFFTDTLFVDANANGAYEQGEGVPGIAVLLRLDGTNYNGWDTSASVGSFAVPIQSIRAGVPVQVLCSNASPGPVTLSIPRDYRVYVSVHLGPKETRVIGAFTQPSLARNIGFRDLSSAPPGPGPLLIVPSHDAIRLSWSSQSGVQYMPQWSSDFHRWNDLEPLAQLGTGSTLSCADSRMSSSNRFYRLVIHQP